MHPIIIYHYAKNRSSANPLKFPEDFKGALQVDGYDGYQAACDKYGIIRLGCFAHARRNFFDAFKSSSSSKIGARSLKFIKDLYKIEDEFENYTVES